MNLQSNSKTIVIVAIICTALLYEAINLWTQWTVNLLWVESLKSLSNFSFFEVDQESFSPIKSQNCSLTLDPESQFPSQLSNAMNRSSGIVCLWLGNYEEAFKFFKHLEPVEKMREEVVLFFGYSVFEIGEKNEAVDIWSNQPNTIFHLVATGERWAEKGEMEKALKYWSVAAKIALQTNQVHSDLFYYLCGSELDNGNIDVALEWCRKAEESTEYPWLLLSIGEKYLQLQALEDAENLARSILGSSSQEAVANTSKRLLGRSLVAQRKYHEAFVVYNELPNTDPYTVYEKGELFYHLDRHEDAYRAFQQVQKLVDLSSPQWQNAENWLQRLKSKQ